MITTSKKLSIQDICKILSSETRVNILKELFKHNGVCVKEIANHIDLSHSATSHQLSILEKHEIVKSKRDGQNNCYEIVDSEISDKIRKVLKMIS